MACPWKAIKGREVGHDAQSERIEVNVTHQLVEVPLLLNQDRLVTILQKMPCSAMTMVEPHRISGEKAPHSAGQWLMPSANKQVKVVGDQSPGQHGETGGLARFGQPINKVIPVLVGPEDSLSVESTYHDMVDGRGRVQTRTSRHGGNHIRALSGCQYVSELIELRPLLEAPA
jgi:hypothetical protein